MAAPPVDAAYGLLFALIATVAILAPLAWLWQSSLVARAIPLWAWAISITGVARQSAMITDRTARSITDIAVDDYAQSRCSG